MAKVARLESSSLLTKSFPDVWLWRVFVTGLMLVLGGFGVWAWGKTVDLQGQLNEFDRLQARVRKLEKQDHRDLGGPR